MLDNCEHAPGSAVTRGCRRCYEELNPAPIPPEHVYSHITIPQLMKMRFSLLLWCYSTKKVCLYDVGIFFN